MEKSDIGSTQYLTFNLDKDNFALEISSVNEIIDFKPLTVLPRMTDFLRGVIDLRGMILPIVDLRVLLNMGRTEKEQDQDTCIIVTELPMGEDKITMGIMVDSVQAVIELNQNNIEPPVNIGIRINTDLIKGIADHGEGFLMILDINRVLSRDELAMLEDASNNAVIQQEPSHDGK